MSEGAVPLITTIFVLSIALAVAVSPVIYNTLEGIEMMLVNVIVVFLLVAMVIGTDASSCTGNMV